MASNQPRDARGRFVLSGVTREHIVRVVKPRAPRTSKLEASGITESHRIAVISKRVRKYKGHETVGSYVASHPKGRATALRTLAADHKAGRIAFETPGASVPVPAAPPPAPSVKPPAPPAPPAPPMPAPAPAPVAKPKRRSARFSLEEEALIYRPHQRYIKCMQAVRNGR